jgi:NAD(P)-dependent dehydrogenase (short-subunit alcohol dehydrogenase family)
MIGIFARGRGLGTLVGPTRAPTPRRTKPKGRPEDIAAACAFFVSEDAGYITGQILGVNGGRNT